MEDQCQQIMCILLILRILQGGRNVQNQFLAMTDDLYRTQVHSPQKWGVPKITIGAIWVKPDNYGLCPDIEAIIGRADDRAQFLFDNNFDKLDGPDAPDLNVRELDEEFIFTLTYAQNSNNFGENYAENVPGSSGFPDSTYKFQGYLIYQLADATVTAQELNDASRARLLYQCDIKDDVVDIYNYEPLSANGQTIYSPVLKITGSNEGIEQVFRSKPTSSLLVTINW